MTLARLVDAPFEILVDLVLRDEGELRDTHRQESQSGA
jgi:hypothetical protein